MFGLFFRCYKKEKKSMFRFPPNWPSYLHNKCNVPTCVFPNPPQAADGTYNCQGDVGGFYCEGTYYVTPSMADAMVKNHVFQTRRASDPKVKAQKALGAQQQGLMAGQQAMALPATTYDLKVTYEPSKHSLSTKNLPPIPGLSQQTLIRRTSMSRTSPPTAPSAPASPRRQGPLYPKAVRQPCPVDSDAVHYRQDLAQRPQPTNPSPLHSSTPHRLRRLQAYPSNASQQTFISVQNHAKHCGSSYTYTNF